MISWCNLSQNGHKTTSHRFNFFSKFTLESFLQLPFLLEGNKDVLYWACNSFFYNRIWMKEKHSSVLNFNFVQSSVLTLRQTEMKSFWPIRKRQVHAKYFILKTVCLNEEERERERKIYYFLSLPPLSFLDGKVNFTNPRQIIPLLD